MLRRLLVFVVVTVGILAAALFGLTRRFTVETNAMEPALKSGDRIAVFRFSDAFSSPGRKDIVVVTRPTTSGCRGPSKQVERIIGLPGEAVAERDGSISVDGKALNEPYVKAVNRGHETLSLRVPQDDYFVLGDKRTAPCARGALVRKMDVVGQVFLTYWPFDRISIG